MNPTKRYYFDTSFLAPLILEEASSLQVVNYLQGVSTGQFLLSSLTRLEFSSLLAREVRMGGLQESEALAAENICDDLLRETFQMVCPALDDYALAGHYIRHYETGLRTADALHLAIAKNQGSDWLLSLDKGLLKAAKMMGIRCGCGIDAPAGRF